MTSGCVECEHLFDDFADATRMHVKALEQSRMAAVEQDTAKLLRLEGQVLAASDRRNETRKAFKDHEAKHHVHFSDPNQAQHRR